MYCEALYLWKMGGKGIIGWSQNTCCPQREISLALIQQVFASCSWKVHVVLFHIAASLRGRAGNLWFALAPSCCSRGPNKAVPEFLVWPLTINNIYWLRKPRTLVYTLLSDFLMMAILMGTKWDIFVENQRCGNQKICGSLMAKGAEPLFRCNLCAYFLKKCLSRASARLFTGLFVFFSFSCKSPLHILGLESLNKYSICNEVQKL